MSHIVKVKVECIDTHKLLVKLMSNKDQLLESIIRLENLNESEIGRIFFRHDPRDVKIWIENKDQSSKLFETTIEEIVFDDEEVFTFFDVPIANKQDLFDLSKSVRLLSCAFLVKKNSEVLSVFESYRGANKFAKSVKADTIEVFRLYL
jgi:hypothetical protein